MISKVRGTEVNSFSEIPIFKNSLKICFLQQSQQLKILHIEKCDKVHRATISQNLSNSSLKKCTSFPLGKFHHL